MLRQEISGKTGVEFVGATVNNRVKGTEIIDWSRRRNAPLKGRSLPRIIYLGPLTAMAQEQGAEEIQHEEKLGGDGGNRGDRNKGAK